MDNSGCDQHDAETAVVTNMMPSWSHCVDSPFSRTCSSCRSRPNGSLL